MTPRNWLFIGAALVGMTGAATPAGAANTFPRIPVWAYPGAFQDVAHTVYPYTTVCAGLAPGSLPDSVRSAPRTVTLRFLRDRVAEARPDFGGYRIYRVINTPDSTQMVLIRRYSKQLDDERFSWFMSTVDPTTLQFKCGGTVVNDSVATFVDPDSSGSYQKICPNLNTRTNRCLADSVFRIVIPPGPHDGFLTYYSVTYELLDVAAEKTREDMFVPDTTGIIGPCTNPADHRTCPNLNNKLANLSAPVTPSGGPTRDLERVLVVPNPYRAREEWEVGGNHDIHFVNLPERAKIRIFTVAGDLVRELDHDARASGNDITSVRDFERWNLKNADGRDISSGIYVFRVESDVFSFQGRFVVIR